MVKKLLLSTLLVLGVFATPAHAQQPPQAFIVSSCGTLPAGVTYAAGQFGILTMDTNGKLCDSATGGGGGLSVTDSAPWTVAVSAFTPTGGVFNDSATALTSGQQGTVRMTANRSMHVLDDNSAALLAAVQGALATQAPTISIGGVGIIDSAGTNVATVKAASTSSVATDKSLVVQINPQQTPPVGLSQVNGTALLANTGNTGAGSPRMTVAVDQATNAGAALVKGGVGVVNGGSNYVHVAASQTGAVLQTSAGATGDYLSHCVIYPSTTAAGSVTVYDNTNSAANNVIEFTTGTLSNLAPIPLPVGAVSKNGAWKADTSTNETLVCFGKFS